VVGELAGGLALPGASALRPLEVADPLFEASAAARTTRGSPRGAVLCLPDIRLLAVRRDQAVVDVTMVEMVPMTEDEIADYVASGEPMDKAGAYALQGMGGVFVQRVIGSPFTVIGLPIHLLDRLMTAAGTRLSYFRLPDDG